MKLSCPSCGAKYSIADEKVQDRLAKIRCRKCSATIIVDGKVNPPSVYTSDGGASPAAEAGDPGGGTAPGEYSVDFGDNDQRAMTADDVVQAYRRGEITEETFVWADGMSDWTAIAQVPELADALAAAAPPAAAPPAAAPRAAARSGAGRGSATDLFGGIATAGSEEDVMTSAPQPAMGAAPAPTGARNESSVLFSLSALTASAPAASPARSSVTNGASDSSDHDSGLIDLKALTSSVTAQAPANPLALGTAPLGMASPLGGITAPAVFTDGPMPQAQSKTGMYMAGALVLVGALIAGAIVMVGSKEAPPAAPSAAAAPVEPATPPVAEAKKEQPTAEPPATGTAATAEPPKEETAKQASTTRSTPRSTGSRAKAPSSTSEKSSTSGSSGSTSSGSSTTSEKSSSSGTSGTSDKPKKKKEKTCNCAPSDLMCAMRCAAG